MNNNNKKEKIMKRSFMNQDQKHRYFTKQVKRSKRQLLKQNFKYDATKINPIKMQFTLEELGQLVSALEISISKDKVLNGKIEMPEEFVDNRRKFMETLQSEIENKWKEVYRSEDQDIVRKNKESA
tara:strand:+ start:61 stop:438 length:378 start_codon:yes stop_codon:yes gene_type:complete